jgi:microcystin-dependent protein
MATSFPSGLDALTNPTSSDGLNSPDHAGQHADANDAIEALEAKVGVDGSAVTSSLDYKIAALTTSSGFVPIGAVTMFSGSTAPTNWAVCDGAELAIATYGPLYAIIGTRYGSLTNGSGGAGTTHFKLPSFTSRIPKGTVGTPTVPTVITSNASSAVDAHTHTVNSTFTAGNANAHTHAIGGSTGNENASHSHSWSANFTTGGQNASHSHVYFKGNSGANNNTGGNNADHSHNFNTGGIGTNNQSANHSHGLPTNTGNANTTIGVNSSLTAGNASTINAQTLAHTHGVNSVDIVFIIRVA